MSEIPNIPQDIIVDILYFLPAKSLARFRCVSKSWFSILTDSIFIRTHLNKNLKNEKFLAIYPSNSLHAFTLSDQNDYVSRKLNFPPNLDQSWLQIIGSCGGLVLASKRYNYYEPEEMFLINPTSSKYKKLPKIPPCPGWNGFPPSTRMHGFVYDEYIHDFKVVVLSFYDGYYGYANYVSVDVYSSKDNCWRNIDVYSPPFDGLDLDCTKTTPGVLLHGAIHWSYEILPSYSSVITVFDLSTEKLRGIELPSDIDGVDFLITNLVVIDCCLCMIVKDYYRSGIEIWMMKEYGVQESWIKLTTIFSGFDILNLVGLVRDEELLVLVPKLDVILNTEKERFRRGVVDGGRALFRDAHTFVESLVSPNVNC